MSDYNYDLDIARDAISALLIDTLKKKNAATDPSQREALSKRASLLKWESRMIVGPSSMLSRSLVDKAMNLYTKEVSGLYGQA